MEALYSSEIGPGVPADTAPVAAVNPPHGVDPHCLRRVIPVVRIEARDHAFSPAPWERYAVPLEDGGQHAWNGGVRVTAIVGGIIRVGSVPAQKFSNRVQDAVQ